MAVPYTFGNATTSIPLSQLDTNFATAITIGNTAVYLGNTTTTFGNVTLNNVTINSGNSTVTKETVTTITSPAATALTIQSAGTTAMTIDTSQNVGIGTTSPGALLELSAANANVYSAIRLTNTTGTGTTPGAAIEWARAGTVKSSIQANTFGNDYMAFCVNGNTERMRIDTSGNVGIGTSSPSNTLDVNGVSRFRQELQINPSGTVQSRIGIGTYSGSSAILGIGNDSGATANTVAFYNAGSERMRIDSSGNVGIGVTSLTYGLEVGGTTTAKSSIRIQNGTAGSSFLLQSDTSGVAYVQQQANAALIFATNNSERARIDSSGNLLLGTTSVNNGKANFVRSDNGDCVIQPYANSTTFNNDIIRAVTTRTSGTTEFLFLACYYNTYSSVRAYIRADGNMYNVNGTYGTISDVKLKENIVDATPKLNDLLQLKVRNFNFIDDELKIKQLGFVAQEVEQVFPNMVDVSREGNKTIKTSVLIPMLVKAIQELKAELDALKGTK